MKINPKMGTLIFVILGALVSIASGIVSYREKLSAEKKSLAKDSIITELKDTLSKVENQLNTRTDEIIALNNKLLDTTESLSNAYKENAELQKNVNAFVTGGDNIPILKVFAVSNPNDGRIKVTFDMSNLGKTPLSSVVLRVWEANGSKNINLGDIPARYSPQIDYEKLLEPGKDTFDILVTVVWKNGGYYSDSKIIRKAFGEVESTTKYYRPDMLEFDPTKDGALKFLKQSR